MVADSAITPADHARLTQEIRAAEQKTSTEIHVVVAHSADDFRLVPFLWAAIAALLLPWGLWFGTGLSFAWILSLQVLLFLILSAVLSIPSLRFRIVPPGLAHDAAHRAALAQFMAHGVHLDARRTAILLYVSLAPRYIEVLADQAVHARLGSDHWNGLVATIRQEARSGRLVDGLSAAIRTTGAILAREFPGSVTRHHVRGETEDRAGLAP